MCECVHRWFERVGVAGNEYRDVSVSAVHAEPQTFLLDTGQVTLGEQFVLSVCKKRICLKCLNEVVVMLCCLIVRASIHGVQDAREPPLPIARNTP